MAEPIPEPSLLNPLWREISTEFLWLTAHCTILKGNKVGQVTKEMTSRVGSVPSLWQGHQETGFQRKRYVILANRFKLQKSFWMNQSARTKSGRRSSSLVTTVSGQSSENLQQISPQWVWLKVTYELWNFKISFPLSLMKLSQILLCFPEKVTATACSTQSFSMPSMTLILYTYSFT